MIGQCDESLLEAALAGTLSAEAESALHQHLDECDSCATQLERLAGEPALRAAVAELLPTDEWDADAPSGDPDEWSDVDFTVEHLEPSSTDGVLGRLGSYDVLEVIGRGGMGVVLKGYDPELKRCVAIKVLAPHLARSSVARKRFAREAQAAAAVVHHNVLAIHQVQATGALPYLVMPLVAGESLAQRLAARGPLELDEVLRIGMQAAAGLAAAHEQGLVHRDVKPANILLERGVERAVLTDFGLARAADDATLTRWGAVAGTPQYMSPEQAEGKPLDARSDLFSLGIVLYEMATGVSPFRAETAIATIRRLIEDDPPAIAALNPAAPPWLIALIECLLKKDPAERFDSAREVSELLEACLAHVQQPTVAPLPQELRTSGAGGSRRLPPAKWTAAGLGFLFVMAGILIVLDWEQEKLTIAIGPEAGGAANADAGETSSPEESTARSNFPSKTLDDSGPSGTTRSLMAEQPLGAGGVGIVPVIGPREADPTTAFQALGTTPAALFKPLADQTESGGGVGDSWARTSLECVPNQAPLAVMGIVDFVDAQYSVAHEIGQSAFGFIVSEEDLKEPVSLGWSIAKANDHSNEWILTAGASRRWSFTRRIRLGGVEPWLQVYGTPDDPDRGADLGIDPASMTWEPASPTMPFWLLASKAPQKRSDWNDVRLLEARDEKNRIVGYLQLRLVGVSLPRDAKLPPPNERLQNRNWLDDTEMSRLLDGAISTSQPAARQGAPSRKAESDGATTELEGDWRLVTIVGTTGLEFTPRSQLHVRGDLATVVHNNVEVLYRLLLGANGNRQAIDLIGGQGPGSTSHYRGIFQVQGESLIMVWNDVDKARPNRLDQTAGSIATWKRIASPSEPLRPTTSSVLSAPLPREIAWGPRTRTNLQVGIWLEPTSDHYAVGDVVTPHFVVRNVGSAHVKANYYGQVEATGNGRNFGNNQWQSELDAKRFLATLAVDLAPGGEHEVAGSPIALGEGGSESTQCTIDARPGDAVRLNFVFADVGAHDPPPEPMWSGAVNFTMLQSTEPAVTPAGAARD